MAGVQSVVLFLSCLVLVSLIGWFVVGPTCWLETHIQWIPAYQQSQWIDMERAAGGEELTVLHSEAHAASEAENVKCEPKREVIFAKTHKTGGTSVQVRLFFPDIRTTSQNILFRTGEKWSLLFVLPRGRRRHFFPLYTYFQTGMAQTYGSKV